TEPGARRGRRAGREESGGAGGRGAFGGGDVEDVTPRPGRCQTADAVPGAGCWCRRCARGGGPPASGGRGHARPRPRPRAQLPEPERSSPASRPCSAPRPRAQLPEPEPEPERSIPARAQLPRAAGEGSGRAARGWGPAGAAARCRAGGWGAGAVAAPRTGSGAGAGGRRRLLARLRGRGHPGRAPGAPWQPGASPRCPPCRRTAAAAPSRPATSRTPRGCTAKTGASSCGSTPTAGWTGSGRRAIPTKCVTDECFFFERLESNNYNTYRSRKYSSWYVALKRTGQYKLGPKTGPGQKAILFLPMSAKS
uniref:AFG2 AAA ATPase homolog A n=1 Tax=Canis lupus familiaris TaxID=9615 RepID=A0A8P0TM83_CANLF